MSSTRSWMDPRSRMSDGSERRAPRCSCRGRRRRARHHARPSADGRRPDLPRRARRQVDKAEAGHPAQGSSVLRDDRCIRPLEELCGQALLPSNPITQWVVRGGRRRGHPCRRRRAGIVDGVAHAVGRPFGPCRAGVRRAAPRKGQPSTAMNGSRTMTARCPRPSPSCPLCASRHEATLCPS